MYNSFLLKKFLIKLGKKRVTNNQLKKFLKLLKNRLKQRLNSSNKTNQAETLLSW